MHTLVVMLLSEVLRALARDGRTAPAPAAVALALGVLDALERTAHDGPHGDVTPDTIAIEHGGGVQLLRARATRPMASPYVAPEQLRRHGVDGKTDVYAVGAVLWELLVGAPLVRGSGASAATSGITTSPVATPPPLVPPSARVPGLPRALDAAVLALLAAEPSERPRSAVDARHRLIAALPDALRLGPGELLALAEGAQRGSGARPAAPARPSSGPRAPSPSPVPRPSGSAPSAPLHARSPAPLADPHALGEPLTLSHPVVTPAPQALTAEGSQLRRSVAARRRDTRLIVLFAAASLLVALTLAFVLSRLG